VSPTAVGTPLNERMTEEAITFYEGIFKCFMTKEYMRDPVQAADGHTYERSAILGWFNVDGNRNKDYVNSPQTGKPMNKQLFRSFDFNFIYNLWCEETGHTPPLPTKEFGYLLMH
jgi:hypothetical protein